MLGNLFDFDPSADCLPYNELTAVDKYMLYNLHCAITQVIKLLYRFNRLSVIKNILVMKFLIESIAFVYFDLIGNICDTHLALGQVFM